jgi:deoxyribodipyrimidine photo-lyase
MSTVIYWFRNDLRLADNPALLAACTHATCLLPVYCHDSAAAALTKWGFPRVDGHRRSWLAGTLAELRARLRSLGSDLVELEESPAEALLALAHRIGAHSVYCEDIAAPEERDAVAALRAAGLEVVQVWQSSLLAPADLPFAPARVPDVFTAFRHGVETAGAHPEQPCLAPDSLPPMPTMVEHDAAGDAWRATTGVKHVATGDASLGASANDARSSFPYWQPAFAAGETAAQGHLQRYFDAGLARCYKTTRNGLSGTDYSSKFSPWLATGALSARQAYAALAAHEATEGANDSTYWLWFELLWRDYFRMLHLKYGRKLYRARGLHNAAPPTHNSQGFLRWCEGRTGEPFIDAGMRELAATGYLSNRMRQNVASYLVHDLNGDWRAGAAWFESQLIDYDVYSNQGNWLYVSGRGTDPRNARRFDPGKQARDYDPQGSYRELWQVG